VCGNGQSNDPLQPGIAGGSCLPPAQPVEVLRLPACRPWYAEAFQHSSFCNIQMRCCPLMMRPQMLLPSSMSFLLLPSQTAHNSKHACVGKAAMLARRHGFKQRARQIGGSSRRMVQQCPNRHKRDNQRHQSARGSTLCRNECCCVMVRGKPEKRPCKICYAQWCGVIRLLILIR